MKNCKILSFLWFIIFCVVKNSNAQTTIFSENCGSPSATTKVGIYTGWQNQGTLVFDSGQVASSADIRSTSFSTTYSGASGSGNVFFSAASGSIGLSIEGINASTFSNLQLNFGYRKESATVHSTFSVDYWNGTSWVTLANTATALFNQTSTSATGWYLSKTITFPVDAQINGLKIRFVKSGTQSIRLDDIKLTGTNSSLSSISVSSTTLNAALSSTYGTVSSAQSVTVDGSGLTSNIIATSFNPGIEISNDGYSYGSTATFVPISNSVNGTLFVRLAATARVGSYNGINISLISSNASSLIVSTRSTGNNVSKKSLFINGISIANKLLDGNNSATIIGSPTLTGLIIGDSAFLYGTPTAQFNTALPGSNIPVNVTGYLVGGKDSGNYLLNQPVGLVANIYDTSNFIINSFPYIQDFESSVSGNGSGIGTLPSGWSVDNFGRTGVPFSWQAFAGSTGSIATGPTVDHTTGTLIGKYIYTESSYGLMNDSTILLSPILNLSGLSVPGISFWFHKVGATMGNLYLEYEKNGSWYFLDSILNQTQSSETDSWKFKYLLFPEQLNSTRIRFIGVRGSSFTGDMALDDIIIFDSILYRPDVGIDSIYPPKKTSCGQVFDSISIVLKNNSSANSSNIPVRMILNGNIIANEIVDSIIPANGKLTYQFKTPIKHINGLNNLQIIQLSADSFPNNDSLLISYQITNSDSFNLTLPDTLRSNSNPITLNPGNAQNFLWSTGETSPTIQVSISGRYSLSASNNTGCESFDTCMVILSNLAPPTSPTIAHLFNYQGIISGISGKPLINESVNLRFSISDSSKINFQETKSVLTDSKGMFSTNVGSGNTLIGSLENISWWDGMQRKLMTEVDTNNSGTWINLGFSNIAAVPISLYSLTSGDGSRKIYGSFDVNGNIVTGNGFSITPIGNGQFEITFQKTFNEFPNVSVKLIGNGPYSDKILQVLKTKTIIQITGNPDRIQFEATGK